MWKSMTAILNITVAATRLASARVPGNKLNLPPPVLDNLRSKLVALEATATISSDPFHILIPALLEFVKFRTVAGGSALCTPASLARDTELQEQLEKWIERDHDYIVDQFSASIARIGVNALKKYIAVNYGPAALEGVEVYEHRLGIASFTNWTCGRDGKFWRDDSELARFTSTLDVLQQEATNWPPDHDVFVRIVKSSNEGWSVEVLPSCLLGDKSDLRWKELLQHLEWRTLFREVQNTVQLKKDRRRQNALFMSILLGFVTVGVALPITMVLLIHWIFSIFVIILSCAGLVGVVKHLVRIYPYVGVATRSKDRKLGVLLRTRCIHDAMLYNQFVKPGIFRIKAVYYEK